MDAVIGTSGNHAAPLFRSSTANMVAEMFSAFRMLDNQGVLRTGLPANAEAADPIIKKITGKGFFDYLHDSLFNKHGRDRLARLVRVHAYRLKENMPQQSVKFFSSLAKKITTFIERTPILKQVFESVKGLAGQNQAVAVGKQENTAIAAATPAKRNPAKTRH